MKKLLTWSSVAVALSFGVVGCGNSTTSGSGNGATQSGGNSSANAKTVTLQFEHWRGEDVPTFKKIIKQFEAKYPNIKVQMTVLPSSKYAAQIQTTLSGSHGADIFATFPGAEFNTLYKMGVYEDLSGQSWLSRFSPSLIKAGQMNGKQYAVPWQLVYNDPLYNVKMFKKYNIKVPKTWSQFLSACQTLKSHGIIPMAWVGQISNTQFINPMLMNNMPSVNIFDKVDSGAAKLTGSWYTKTLTQIKQLYDKGYFQKDPTGTSKQGAIALFASGKAAMFDMGSYDMVNAQKLNPKLQVGMLAPNTTTNSSPKYGGIYTSTFMLGINKNSKHIKQAEEFLNFLTKPKMASLYANGTGQFLTEKGISYTSKDLQYLSKTWLPKQNLMFQPRYTIKNPGVQKAVETSVSNIMSGMSVTKAAQTAQKQVQQAIKQGS
ncbi:ABC transporter substrate-binding protein [Alicyclobacillus sp. SO9]|uniref:ABC transporter substrate-binding protein n=1 Tax=Alicyclobacillus sp. SO9 TaxID=2665646 RepID=UPI0018E7D8C3|nr:extracellular solute-binding protein [Alicyclobacillus sp. SO9]QQE80476.1 extracellular solute-binding protein [Alicyclobacillus sp. SO9]